MANYKNITFQIYILLTYRGSYSSVTFSGNTRNEIRVMRFRVMKYDRMASRSRDLAPTVARSVHANDLSLEICVFLWNGLCSRTATV